MFRNTVVICVAVSVLFFIVPVASAEVIEGFFNGAHFLAEETPAPKARVFTNGDFTKSADAIAKEMSSRTKEVPVFKLRKGYFQDSAEKWAWGMVATDLGLSYLSFRSGDYKEQNPILNALIPFDSREDPELFIFSVAAVNLAILVLVHRSLEEDYGCLELREKPSGLYANDKFRDANHKKKKRDCYYSSRSRRAFRSTWILFSVMRGVVVALNVRNLSR